MLMIWLQPHPGISSHLPWFVLSVVLSWSGLLNIASLPPLYHPLHPYNRILYRILQNIMNNYPCSSCSNPGRVCRFSRLVLEPSSTDSMTVDRSQAASRGVCLLMDNSYGPTCVANGNDKMLSLSNQGGSLVSGSLFRVSVLSWRISSYEIHANNICYPLHGNSIFWSIAMSTYAGVWFYWSPVVISAWHQLFIYLIY